MRGQFLPVWSAVWREIFRPLIRHPEHGDSCAIELYRTLVPEPAHPGDDPRPPAEAYDAAGDLIDPEWIEAERAYKKALADFDIERAIHEEIAASPKLARKALRPSLAKAAATEAQARHLIEASFDVVDEFSEDFSNRHFNRIDAFIERYSLRYELKRPFKLFPTLPGVFAMLIRGLREHCQTDAHLYGLLREFEDAFRDLYNDTSAGRIQTAIQKQFILAEGLGCSSLGKHGLSLGDVSKALDSWPHPTLNAALQNLWGFRSDFPGLGHAGNPAAKARDVDMRDLVALSVVLSGFSPYLSDALNADHAYLGD